jgi:tryptophan 2,3-dioxygenase
MKKELPEDIRERIAILEEKYEAMGQDMRSYLDGLIEADYLTYWDYVHLDTLLSLQSPKTAHPDEHIFIIYHQITELYFKLILHEIHQLAYDEELSAETYKKRMGRINNYFTHLTHSFSIMINGMDKDQFLSFRMALLPASGFQSGQYRMIELCSTNIHNLIVWAERDHLKSETATGVLLDNLYWKHGGRELKSGNKTLTLRQFEKKYARRFRNLVEEYRNRNLWYLYDHLPADEKDEELTELLREFDYLANVAWPLAHYRSAARYMQRDPEDIAATGGTNWQKYLPPKNQQIVFFPDLWTEEEISEWGKKTYEKKS